MTTPQQADALRQIVQKFLDDNDTEGFGCACTPQHECGPCQWNRRTQPLRAALATTSAEPAGAEAESAWAYFVDGPRNSDLVKKHEDIEPAIKRMCAQTSDDPDDYTATALFPRFVSGPKVAVAPTAEPPEPICTSDPEGHRQSIADGEAERDATGAQERGRVDAERLQWMQFHSARVEWGNDGEFCCVAWSDPDDSYKTKLFGDWREAIDAARSKTP